jgi:hypothetical protein
MNTLPKFLAATFLTALCVGSTPAVAQTTDVITFTQASPASLRLHITNAGPLAGRVEVVRLSSGQTLFTETYEAPFSHRFDFSRAPSGRYLVRLQAGATTHRCIVRVHTQANITTAQVAKLTSRAASPSVAVVGSSVVAPTISAVTNAASKFEGQQLR